MNKSDLRQLYKDKRSLLSAVEIECFSKRIAENVFRIACFDLQYYHVFSSIKQQKEVDTRFIMDQLKLRNKQIVVSQCTKASLVMRHYLLDSVSAFECATFGISQPTDGIIIETLKLDVVFIPLLAFDKEGNRLGYGKGYYDVFLASCRPDVIKIGLSFFEPESDLIPSESHDIKLDFCVTPNAIIRF